MVVMARVEGKAGVVRELPAAIDFNYVYCTVLRQDALDLGYPQGANKHTDEQQLHPERTPWFASLRGIDRGIMVTFPSISVGPVVAKDVDAVILEMEHPRQVVVDMILGRSFLKHCKLSVDFRKGSLSLD